MPRAALRFGDSEALANFARHDTRFRAVKLDSPS